MGYVLIIGATSDIGKALAYEYAANGYDIYLAARQSERLIEFAKDINVRYGANVICSDLDILDYSSHFQFYEKLPCKPTGIISVVGYLGDQVLAQSDTNEAQKIINTNFTGIMNLLEIGAADLSSNKNGFIIGISSVAGDRGRQSNYIYGSAKAAFSAYLSGLRNRLTKSNVHVLTVKPGFVNTKMTKNMNLPKLLTAQPAEVAKDIYTAQKANKNVIYTKRMWRLIMLIINNIPEILFKKMNL